MKTNKFRQALVALVSAAACAGFAACETDPVEMKGGKLPDKEAIEQVHGILRSSSTSEDEVRIRMTEGTGFVTNNFYYQLSQPSDLEMSLDTWINGSLIENWNNINEVQRMLLPEINYDFPDGNKIELSVGDRRSTIKRIRFMAKDLAPGEYYLPLSAAKEGESKERQIINYLVSIRARQLGEYQLNQEGIFTVLYLNTAKYQPLLVDEYLMSKFDANWDYVWNERADGLRTFGDIVNLTTVVLDYETAKQRAVLNLGADMRYVLDHADKYIRPLQDKGRKICICLEGGGKGLGFCNLNDAQIADFAAQVAAVVTEYALDGINLWDRNAGYGKEGMPPMNTTSYPKLIKALREALDPDKLLTITDYQEPTEYFWNTEATGGIEVGQYLDYAWSGYINNETDVQIVDPWHQGAEYVSTDYTRKPFAGLDPSKYGCINIPWYSQNMPENVMAYLTNIFFWREAGYKQSNILVFESVRTLLQDNYESTWAQSIRYGYMFFADDGTWLIEDGKWGLSILNDNEYDFDLSLLSNIDQGTGYNKWTKDW